MKHILSIFLILLLAKLHKFQTTDIYDKAIKILKTMVFLNEAQGCERTCICKLFSDENLIVQNCLIDKLNLTKFTNIQDIKIKVLSLEDIGLKYMPTGITKYSNLEELYLSNNNLNNSSDFCLSIRSLKNLGRLHITNNKFVPEEVTKIKMCTAELNKELNKLNKNITTYFEKNNKN